MENPCNFFKAVLAHKNQRAINRLVYLGSKEKEALKAHISECSTCQQTIKKIRDTGSNLMNFGMDTHFGRKLGRD